MEKSIDIKSDIYRTLPKNKEEEHSQLELAISASMNVQPSKKSRGIECSQPSKAVVLCDKTCSENSHGPLLTDESAAIALLSLNSKGH